MHNPEKLRRNAKLAMAIVLALMIVCVALIVTSRPAEGADPNGRPPIGRETCTTVDQPECTALLRNSWDGRQVLTELDPVPSCDTSKLRERLDRKNAKLRELRERIAKLRGR